VKRYQSALQRVISSISASSDAVQVDPVGAPQPGEQRGTVKGAAPFGVNFLDFSSDEDGHRTLKIFQVGS